MSSPRLHHGRHSSVGNIYALTSVVHSRVPHFRQPCLAQHVAQVMQALAQEQMVRNFAWVVMPDHVHWLMQLRHGSLGGCMQRFKSRSSLLVNRQLNRSGPLWQAGYFDHTLRNDEDLRHQAAYILANPVRAGLAHAIGHYPFAWCRWPIDDLPPATPRPP
ncbi:REP-associated tyrosine transposase [Stenotrophomonas rhizophila]